MAKTTPISVVGVIDLSDDAKELMKVGRRNSSADEERLRRLRELGNELNQILGQLGLEDEKEPESEETKEVGAAEEGVDSESDPRAKSADVPVEPLESATKGEDTLRSGLVLDDVKSVGNGKLRHYAVLWGDDENRDVSREYFTRETQDLDTIFKSVGKLPLLYHHAMDNKVKTSVVGLTENMGMDDIGLWVESQLDMSNRYATAVQKLAENRKLGTSTGTLPGARRVKSSGEIERWAIVEVSLTPTPAEPNLLLTYPVEVVKAAYTEIGLEMPEQSSSLLEDTGAEKARQQERARELERERLALLAF